MECGSVLHRFIELSPIPELQVNSLRCKPYLWAKFLYFHYRGGQVRSSLRKLENVSKPLR